MFLSSFFVNIAIAITRCANFQTPCVIRLRRTGRRLKRGLRNYSTSALIIYCWRKLLEAIKRSRRRHGVVYASCAQLASDQRRRPVCPPVVTSSSALTPESAVFFAGAFN